MPFNNLISFSTYKFGADLITMFHEDSSKQLYYLILSFLIWEQWQNHNFCTKTNEYIRIHTV